LDGKGKNVANITNGANVFFTKDEQEKIAQQKRNKLLKQDKETRRKQEF